MQASEYPTWAVNLWLSNDEGLYNEVEDIVQRNAGLTDSTYAVAEGIEAFVRELVEMDEASLRSDLIGNALDQVDWQKIARDWIES